MKHLIPLLMLLTFEATSSAGWFNHDQEQQQINQLQDQLQQEKRHSNDLGAVIVVLGIGCCATLVGGTIIGSRARRKANAGQ